MFFENRDNMSVTSAEIYIEPTSFEAVNLKDYLRNSVNDDQSEYRGKRRFISQMTTWPECNGKILLKTASYNQNLNFEVLNYSKIINNSEDVLSRLLETNTDFQLLKEKIDDSKLQKIEYIPELLYVSEEYNVLQYQVGVYAQIVFEELKSIMQQNYRLKYINKKDRQECLIFAKEGMFADLQENGFGRVEVSVPKCGTIGEIGVKDSENFVEYLCDNNYLVIGKIKRIITGNVWGAVITISVYNHPLKDIK